MTQEIEVKAVVSQPTLTIRTTTSMAEMNQALGEIFPSVWAYMEENGGTPASMPFTMYHKTDMEKGEVDMECGMALVEAIEGNDRIQAGRLPNGRVATTSHVGSYDTLADTHAHLHQWIAEHNYQQSGPMWEVYVTDPGQEPDPSKWQTDIFYPVKEK